jgi:PAS domain S-box-containing protein
LRTLTDNLPLAVYMKDTAGRKTLVNPVDLRNFGVTSAAEVLGKTDSDFFPPEQAAAFHADDQRVFDTGQPVLNRVERPTRPDGSLRWFLTSKVPLFDAAGRVTGLAGMGLDITDQKQAELALANERALLRSLVDNLPLAVYMKDIAGRKTMANPVDLYNQGTASEAEILGKTDFDIFPPEQAAAFHADDQLVLDGQSVFNREEKLTRPDGSVLWLLTSKVPLRDATGKVTGLAGFGLDITERRNIAEAHDQLALAVEQAGETIVITDPGGTILYANPAFEKSTGYTRAEALGQTPRMLKSGKQDAEFYRRMWEVLERGEVWTGHFINKRKDGALYEEEATLSPIRDAAGQIINYVAVKRDVTREVQLDTQLRQSQKMEAIGQLAGGVAHDFNNILAIIQMQASLLKSGGNLSADQLEMADEIGNTVDRAAALTRQLLLFSRREALQMRDLDLSAAITNLTKMLRRVLGETITVQINLSAQPMFVHADAGMMEQVLLNLAVNARDAMLNGGQMVISTAGVEFDELSVAQSPSARLGAFLCLSVGDTGCGIPPEILPRIFEPFFTTKDVGKGTGLGLATVFGIVQRHEGWINVYSEAGRGTTFKIYLPRLVGLTARSIAEKMLATPPTGQETILLVEDETALRNSVHKILARLGYRILEAPTGGKALEVWKEHHAEIRLLLTDLVMPEGMSGKDLAQRLLGENPKLKVIYMSGYSAELAGHDLSLQEGVNFLAKPFQMQRLAQTIRNRLDQST